MKLTAAKFLIAFFTLFVVNAHAAIQTKEITYKSGDTQLKGFLAWDDAIKGKTPGVLVVHEWWGHNAYSRERAKKLAQLGYTAFALDMYGDGKLAQHPKEATGFFEAVMNNSDTMRTRFNAALATLKQQPTVDTSHIGAIGYCMGGAIVLRMAREGADLDLVASFHGALGTQTRAKKGDIKGSVMVFHGEADSMVPMDQVAALKTEMKDAGVNFTYDGYPGVKHSFTNPEADSFAKQFGMDLAYDAKADTDSWSKLQAGLKTAFAKQSSVQK